MPNKTSPLHQQKCEPCSGDTPVLTGPQLQNFYERIADDWELVDEHHLHRVYKFDDFREALEFTYQIGEMSEQENHHPNIELTWGKVEVTIYTHAIDGLSENDFIWASKADTIFDQEKFKI